MNSVGNLQNIWNIKILLPRVCSRMEIRKYCTSMLLKFDYICVISIVKISMKMNFLFHWILVYEQSVAQELTNEILFSESFYNFDQIRKKMGTELNDLYIKEAYKWVCYLKKIYRRVLSTTETKVTAIYYAILTPTKDWWRTFVLLISKWLSGQFGLIIII